MLVLGVQRSDLTFISISAHRKCGYYLSPYSYYNIIDHTLYAVLFIPETCF